MPGLTKRDSHSGDLFSRFDQMLDEWTRAIPFRPMNVPQWWQHDDLIRVEEFREDGTFVIRAELPGVDPDKDIELTVSGGILGIHAERHEEEKHEQRGYLRQELRYGALSRSLPLPDGVRESDIKATYESGVLEIRIPEPDREPAAKKIPIARS